MPIADRDDLTTRPDAPAFLHGPEIAGDGDTREAGDLWVDLGGSD